MSNVKIARLRAASEATISSHAGRVVLISPGKSTTGRMMALMEGSGVTLFPPLTHNLSATLQGSGTRDRGSRAGALGASPHALPTHSCDSRQSASAAGLPVSKSGSVSETGLSVLLRAAAAPFRKLWRWMYMEHAISRGIEELSDMDDRTLRDLGIHRSQIPHIVRYGLDANGMAEIGSTGRGRGE